MYISSVLNDYLNSLRDWEMWTWLMGAEWSQGTDIGFTDQDLGILCTDVLDPDISGSNLAMLSFLEKHRPFRSYIAKIEQMCNCYSMI